jgi:hypothetical protein
MSHGKTGYLIASNIRYERTGWHAQIAVVLDNRPLESDNFNIERSEERGRLARRAYEQIFAIEGDGITASVWTAEKIKIDLLQFSHWIRMKYEQTQNEIVSDDMEPVRGLDWLISPYVLGGAATTMFAPATAGKSTVALAMAISLATGATTLWEVEHPVPVLWVNLERPTDSVKLRARQLAAALGVGGDYGVKFLHRRGNTLPMVGPGIGRWVQENPGGFVFLDSISRGGLGKLVEDQTANAFTDTMHKVAPAGWLGIGHTSKADSNQMYGNTMFSAGADIELRLRSQAKETELGVKIELASSNHTSKHTSMTLAFSYEGDALITARKADEGEFSEIVALSASQSSRTQRINEFFEQSAEGTATEISEATGIDLSDVTRMLNKSVASGKGDYVRLTLSKPYRYGLASKREEDRGY